jgi:2-methylisocitrate lyase-like PEP mutase family enzyme
VVWRGKTPELALDDARRAGYKLAIVPGLLFKAVIGVCDGMLAQLKAQGRHPQLDTQMTVKDAFRRVGAEEWDRMSERFRATKDAPKQAQGAN